MHINFASLHPSSGFNQTSSASFNVFSQQPTNSLFSNVMPFKNSHASIQNKSYESTGKISPNLFDQPRNQNDLSKLNGKDDKNLNIFGNPRNNRKSNEEMEVEKIKRSEHK